MRYLYILVFLIFSGTAFAQLTQNIRGKIVDKEAKYGIPGVSVMVVGLPTMGNVTDEEGNFKINKVPVGRQTIKVTYVG
jgi:hypothetical protein